jgi:metal-responsive CopG/Arc/MetJ family transcriptional regulator
MLYLLSSKDNSYVVNAKNESDLELEIAKIEKENNDIIVETGELVLDHSA